MFSVDTNGWFLKGCIFDELFDLKGKQNNKGVKNIDFWKKRESLKN